MEKMSLSNFVGPHPTSQEDPIVTQTECLSSHFPAHMVLYQDLQCSSRSPTVIMTQAAPKKCFRLLTRTFRRHMQQECLILELVQLEAVIVHAIPIFKARTLVGSQPSAQHKSNVVPRVTSIAPCQAPPVTIY